MPIGATTNIAGHLKVLGTAGNLNRNTITIAITAIYSTKEPMLDTLASSLN